MSDAQYGRVVAAEVSEAALNSASAEHQKFSGGAGADKFSSPFAFSQAGEELNHQASSPKPVPSYTAEIPQAQTMGMPGQQVVHVSWSSYQAGPGGQMPASMMHPPMASMASAPMYAMPAAAPCQPPGCMPGQPPSLVVEGWLSKRAEDFGKTWMNRWFVLHSNGVLSYSKEQTGKDAKQIFLDGSTQVRVFSQAMTDEGRRAGLKRTFGLELYQGPGRRTWYLDPGSKDKRDLWMSQLQMVLGQFKGPGQGYA